MAAIENLEIVVDVDISSAVADLEELQNELQDIAETISEVDARGSEGIDINTSVDNIDDELTVLTSKIEAWEAANEIDINTNVDSNVGGKAASAAAGSGGFDAGRFTIPNFQNAGTLASPEQMAAGFDWLDLPGGGGGGGKEAGKLTKTFRRLRNTVEEVIPDLSNFKLRMSDLHNLLASIIPLIVIILGTLPALITALVTLAAAAISAAAALGAIGILGALGAAGGPPKKGAGGNGGWKQAMTDAFNQITSMFWEAFAPLAKRLAPLFKDAMDGLEQFLQAIANQGDALMRLTDEARAFGGFIMDIVPTILRVMSGLVEAMAPIFGNIGQFLKDNLVGIVRELVRITAKAVPALAQMALTIGRALPAIVEMSVGFTQIATAVFKAMGAIGKLLGFLGVTSRQLGVVVASILAVVSALALARFVTQSFIGTLIKGLFAVMAELVATNLFGAESFLALSGAELVAAGALAAFLTLATLGASVALVAMATSAAAGFLGLAGSIDSATSSLKDFNSVAGKTSGNGFNPYGAGKNGAGAADVTAGPGAAHNGGKTVINIESSGNDQQDRDNARYASWRQGRTTGGNN